MRPAFKKNFRPEAMRLGRSHGQFMRQIIGALAPRITDLIQCVPHQTRGPHLLQARGDLIPDKRLARLTVRRRKCQHIILVVVPAVSREAHHYPMRFGYLIPRLRLTERTAVRGRKAARIHARHHGGQQSQRCQPLPQLWEREHPIQHHGDDHDDDGHFKQRPQNAQHKNSRQRAPARPPLSSGRAQVQPAVQYGNGNGRGDGIRIIDGRIQQKRRCGRTQQQRQRAGPTAQQTRGA